MRAENKGLRCLVRVVSEFLQKTTRVGIATSKLTVSGHDGDGSNRSPFRRLTSGMSIAETRPWLTLGPAIDYQRGADLAPRCLCKRVPYNFALVTSLQILIERLPRPRRREGRQPTRTMHFRDRGATYWARIHDRAPIREAKCGCELHPATLHK